MNIWNGFFFQGMLDRVTKFHCFTHFRNILSFSYRYQKEMFYCMKLGIYAGLKKVFALCDVGFCIVAIVEGKVDSVARWITFDQYLSS